MKTNEEMKITVDNVQHFGELIAIGALKTYARYSNGALITLYKSLLRDVFRPSTQRRFSDGYDIAQEAICFLCNFIGKSLLDTTTDRYGNYYD